MYRFSTPWGDLDLTRYPQEPREQLRAWDAADDYLLRHLDEKAPAAGGTTVVLGDRWGALVTALAGREPVQVSDSYLGQQATRDNLRRIGAQDRVRLLSTRESRGGKAPERIDLLLVRVPKSLALLEDQLHALAPAVHRDTVVVGTGMVTEIHTSTLALFERILGPTVTSLAVRKARLIFCTPDPDLSRGANPWPLRYALPDGIGPMSGRTVTNHAGVFCADRLDVGTRLLLGNLPRRQGPDRVIDLGCGNGVVGTAAALANPASDVLFTDESHQAVASAEATFRDNADPATAAEFLVADAAAGVPAGSADLVLNNPPFHSHRATSDSSARRMFATARAALRPGGELWVVGNRHLGYHVRLRRLFGNCEVVASDPKFVVLRAVRQAPRAR
ncbi:methyltransferase [Actinacidiphila bryophytorum]|uniref:Ribosomal RNA large subunit methyltransferase G n=1 Tax=Actinacidiphila bryophytorum TaxID=1436133 RepID=A0A9W4H6Z3_9ACTN|nr:methyltransferase [Actinacidiphila bryophytorum]MBM9437702.1 methyltransferase [Actinacidiphila bryophytorum]MBN6545182.1 methyltransferase [Actinacidiphila bryophytorum]CAG7656663.1 Ribosomal RNA large subunit methyltransferase G [Actinacidiphila bryophytorum]